MMDQGNTNILKYYCWGCETVFSFEKLEKSFKKLGEKEIDSFGKKDLPRVRSAVRKGNKLQCPKCRQDRCSPVVRCPKCRSGVRLWGETEILLAECENCGHLIDSVSEVLENINVKQKAIEKYLSKNPEADLTEISGHLHMKRHEVQNILNSRGDN